MPGSVPSLQEYLYILPQIDRDVLEDLWLQLAVAQTYLKEDISSAAGVTRCDANATFNILAQTFGI